MGFGLRSAWHLHYRRTPLPTPPPLCRPHPHTAHPRPHLQHSQHTHPPTHGPGTTARLPSPLTRGPHTLPRRWPRVQRGRHSARRCKPSRLAAGVAPAHAPYRSAEEPTPGWAHLDAPEHERSGWICSAQARYCLVLICARAWQPPSPASAGSGVAYLLLLLKLSASGGPCGAGIARLRKCRTICGPLRLARSHSLAVPDIHSHPTVPSFTMAAFFVSLILLGCAALASAKPTVVDCTVSWTASVTTANKVGPPPQLDVLAGGFRSRLQSSNGGKEWHASLFSG